MYQSGKTTTLWNYSLLAGERRTSGKRIRGCAWDVTHAVSMQRARSSSLGLFSGPYSPECVEGEFSEVRSKGELLLDNRLGWLWGGYGVRVPMHYLPGAILGSKIIVARSAYGVISSLSPTLDSKCSICTT